MTDVTVDETDRLAGTNGRAAQPGTTARLAAFAAGLHPADVPERMAALVKRHLLDQLGVQLACGALPWVRIATDYVARHGRSGAATLLGDAARYDAELAAFGNAIAGHAFELDDSARGASAHPGCVTVPTVLAVGEELDSSGADALAALAAGFETVTRVGIAMTPSLLLHRGFHETCVDGVFGAAAAAGRLLGLDQQAMVATLGIAGSHASGTTEYTQSGGDVKRLHAGLGAMGGVRSARLAQAGFTAPAAILEGKRGVLQAFCQEYDETAITRDLGRTWEFADRATLKPSCCAASIIAQINAAEQAVATSGRRVADIATIRVGLDRKSMTHIGSIGPEPKDATGAQFSTHYSVALALVKGASDFDTYLAALRGGFADPDVLDLARRVTVELDPECDAEYPERWLGKVDITFADGTATQGRSYAKGSPLDPMTDDEVRDKFLSLAGRVVPRARALAVVDLVDRLADLGSVGELLAPLRER
jgi:2-methylcitrate dehydratase PrpD